LILSKREIEVLSWLKEGKTSWEIARILQITERTVNFHVRNIMKKLDANNRTHAVAIAVADRLFDV
jgi:LuxR family transcriptional regulator, quorum-sensing system regulator CviR